MVINSIDVLKKLKNGEKVKCISCREGYYIPIGKGHETCTHFQCNKCNEMVIATIKYKKLQLR